MHTTEWWMVTHLAYWSYGDSLGYWSHSFNYKSTWRAQTSANDNTFDSLLTTARFISGCISIGVIVYPRWDFFLEIFNLPAMYWIIRCVPLLNSDFLQGQMLYPAMVVKFLNSICGLLWFESTRRLDGLLLGQCYTLPPIFMEISLSGKQTNRQINKLHQKYNHLGKGN